MRLIFRSRRVAASPAFIAHSQVLYSSLDVTVPTGAVGCLAKVWGGGCGGGRTAGVGRGGPGAGYCELAIDVTVDAGETLVCVVGQGGPGRVNGTGNGSAGTPSSITGASIATPVAMVANGGAPAVGGTASGGSTNYTGQLGAYPTGGTANNGNSLGGQIIGDSATDPGGGGAGGGTDQSEGLTWSAGDGGPGLIELYWT